MRSRAWLPHCPRHQPPEHDGAHEREADDAGGVDAQDAGDAQEAQD